MSKKHVLIVGTGSVGMRHGRNLTSLGARVSGMDPSGERLATFMDEFHTLAYENLDDALNMARTAQSKKEPKSIGLLGNAADIFRS